MELMQCVDVALSCVSQVQANGIGAAIAGGLAMVATVIGVARMFFKPLQPLLLKVVDMGPLKKVKWDNKVMAFIAWFIDATLSIKVLNKEKK